MSIKIVTGGRAGGRSLDCDSAFEQAVRRALGERVKRSRATSRELWAALANVRWRHRGDDEVAYSYRAAGDLVAALRGQGDYLAWYCCTHPGLVTPDIARAMATEGWAPNALTSS